MNTASRTSRPLLRRVVLLASHAFALLVGFVAGVFTLPILIAPDPLPAAEVQAHAAAAKYMGRFRRDLKDSDALHWGEGIVSVDARSIAFEGTLAPGPDYKLYLSPRFVETEAEFNQLKQTMARVGDVRAFGNFLLAIPGSIDIERFDTVVIWCETFGQFITAAKYR